MSNLIRYAGRLLRFNGRLLGSSEGVEPEYSEQFDLDQFNSEQFNV